MTINVLLFGVLKDIVGKEMITLNEVIDTDELIQKLQAKYPQLENSKCMIAVDRNIIQENTMLNENVEVAVLPPFSGG